MTLARARATAGFGWVMRQAALQEGASSAFPPDFVLRRGWASSAERALVFVALLPHLGIDGCMIVIPGPDGGQRGSRYWIPGALIDNEIYLFDTRMGMPLPGSKAGSIATLREVRQHPEVLQSLSFDDKHRYDVTPDDVRRAEVCVAAYLSAVSPRMAHLEGLLAASNNKVSLSVDPAAVLERFREATKGQSIVVKTWSFARESLTPIAVQRDFLPPDEGGIDKTHRKARAEAEVVPWNALPSILGRRFPADTELGRRIRAGFQAFFVDFVFDPKDRQEAKRQRAAKNRKTDERTNGSSGGGEDPTLLISAGSRDLMLHGRFEEATVPLVDLRDELRKVKAAVEENPEVQAGLEKWSDEFAKAYVDMLRTERAQAAGDRDPARLKQARARVAALVGESGAPLSVTMLAAAAEPLTGLATYFLALCKHEQAERLQSQVDRAASRSKHDAEEAAREAWKGAADWWETYLSENPPTIWSNTARLLRSRALAGLGNRPGAAALLQDLNGTVSTLDQVGRLYRAKQLQKQ